MDRRNFLAVIPSLGALPFLGKDIVKEKNRIIIEEPKQIEVVQEMPRVSDYQQDKFQILICYDGKVVGTANRTNIGIASGVISNAELSLYSHRHRQPRLTIEMQFDHDEMCTQIYRAMRES